MSLLPLCAALLIVPAAAQEGFPPVGFFHFNGYEELDGRYTRGALVRTSIAWGEFEPAPGRFDWDNPSAAQMQELFSKGFGVIPAIRSKSPWAVEDPGASKCASAPRDLDLRQPLAQGRSYSPAYHRFVKAVARRYKGRFPIVVIENEMNDADDFWCSSIDAYLRLFLTAQTAYREEDPTARLADGGVQGAALNRMLLEEFARRRDPAGAEAFQKRFSGGQKGRKGGAQKENVRRAWELYRGPLYDWVDVANFHYYQKTDGLPEVVAFLKKRTGKKPLMSNEVGIKWKFVGNERDKAAQELVKKCALLLGLGVRPVIWFSPPGAKGNNAGALTTRKALVPETSAAFSAANRFLRGTPSPVDRPGLKGFKFQGPQDRAEVYWPSGSSAALAFPGNCRAYDHQNRALPAGPLQASAPVFLLCGL